MKSVFLKFSLLFFSSTCLLSCISSKKNQTTTEQINYPDGVWELASIHSVQNINDEFPDQLPTLIFDINEPLKAFGNDGCSKYRANFLFKSKNKIQIKTEVIEKAVCENINSDLYLNTLKQANSINLSENILKINTQTDTLKFYKVSLEGKWFLTKINTVKKKVADLYPYKKPFINIDIRNNSIKGFTACNSINATMLLHQKNISFSEINSTKMFCDQTDTKELTAALVKVTDYELKGTNLILLEKNKIILEFKRQYE